MAQVTEKRIQQAEADDSPMQLITKLDKEKSSAETVVKAGDKEVTVLSTNLEGVNSQLRATKAKHETLDKETVIEIDASM